MTQPPENRPVETTTFGVLPVQIFTSTAIPLPPGTAPRPRPDRVWPEEAESNPGPTGPQRRDEPEPPNSESTL